MNRLALLAPLLALVGCAGQPCTVSSECGGGEVCAASRCQALSCESTWTAIDPADGTCRPLPGCGNPEATREWVSCADPCPAMREWDCVADRRCQPTYNFERRFQGCHANPLPIDRCAVQTREQCDAEPFCVAIGFDVDCNCELGGGCEKCEYFECQPRACAEMHESECGQNPRCTTGLNSNFANSPPFDLGFGAPPFDAGAPSTGTRSDPFFGCGELFFVPCFALTQSDCRRRADCHPVDGEDFQGCEPDDGLRRCDDSSQCAAGERCNSDEPCGSPGLPQNMSQQLFGFACHSVCVPAGCPGYGQERCDQDESCEPVYRLQCSPYGGGFGPDGSCEPSFIACSNGPRGPVVDPARSVLCREPEVVDHVAFSFPTVMARLAGSHGAAALVDGWLGQLGADQRVGDRTALKRPLATSYLAGAAHTADGHLDPGRLGFQVTSLSNRIDLAGPNDCGEARITYALENGVIDRFNRMTVIVELRQPDDGTRCQATAQKWLALSTLEGTALSDALIAIYDPLLTPSSLNQVRTNEFLVGKPDFSRRPVPWELREWRLGDDGLLHLAPSKQALDPSALFTAAWNDWLALNRDSVVRSAALLPDPFLAVTSSENGGRLMIDDPEVDRAINKMACAGCHTTESNTAFTHVGERFQGRGRAQISEMLLKELPRRARMLEELATGRRRTLDARIAAALTH